LAVADVLVLVLILVVAIATYGLLVLAERVA